MTTPALRRAERAVIEAAMKWTYGDDWRAADRLVVACEALDGARSAARRKTKKKKGRR